MSNPSNNLTRSNDPRPLVGVFPSTHVGTLLYRLDVDDRLVEVNDVMRTSSEGEMSDAPEALHSGQLGLSLWDLLFDATTQQLFKLLFRRVRASGRALSLPYRCDTPARIRQMEMTIVPEVDGRLSIHSRTLQELERSPIALLEADGWRRDEYVRLCSWCKRLEMEEAWEELDVAVVRQPDLMQWPLPRVSHGMCDDCERSITATLDMHGD